ncbi:MAG: hypothetical protein ETSY2_15690 [Candidatus Entotheonella gemina]|uniref:Uncharacterized protein n=1 Tax=Candidatus Entotheonella gemina TaxID=1429439 RepID=W4M9T7_9BACT|nr:MAG: hypothetical protein ETSY2_15690 [Candidatus Entotheonella gemina]
MAMAHFGKEWHELDLEGWLPVEVDVVLPDWLLAAHST